MDSTCDNTKSQEKTAQISFPGVFSRELHMLFFSGQENRFAKQLFSYAKKTWNFRNKTYDDENAETVNLLLSGEGFINPYSPVDEEGFYILHPVNSAQLRVSYRLCSREEVQAPPFLLGLWEVDFFLEKQE